MEADTSVFSVVDEKKTSLHWISHIWLIQLIWLLHGCNLLRAIPNSASNWLNRDKYDLRSRVWPSYKSSVGQQLPCNVKKDPDIPCLATWNGSRDSVDKYVVQHFTLPNFHDAVGPLAEHFVVGENNGIHDARSLQVDAQIMLMVRQHTELPCLSLLYKIWLYKIWEDLPRLRSKHWFNAPLYWWRQRCLRYTIVLASSCSGYVRLIISTDHIDKRPTVCA